MLGRLVFTFLAVTLLEIYVIIQVGHLIGGWWTLFLLIAETLFGAWLVHREGRRAWRTVVADVNEGRTPTTAAANGAVILLGGVLLITPGFVTDALGFLCLIPPTRALIRRGLTGYVTRRSLGIMMTVPGSGQGPGQTQRPGEPTVIEGHLVDPPDRD